MITAEKLFKSFGSHEALRGVDLTIEKGEMFALIGPDGAGKTTFFRIATGLVKPTSGNLKNDGLSSQGFVPQRFAMYTDLSVDENLALRAQLYGVDRKVAKSRAADLLSRVGLDRFGSRLAGQLSGGMKQKLALVSRSAHHAVTAAARRADDRRRPALAARILDDAASAASRRADDRRLDAVHGRGVVCHAHRVPRSRPPAGDRHAARADPLATRARSSKFARAIAQAVRPRLSQVPQIDDVSLFGTVLHVRGAAGVGGELIAHRPTDSYRARRSGRDNSDRAVPRRHFRAERRRGRRGRGGSVPHDVYGEPLVRVRDLTRRFGSFVAADHVNFDVPKGLIFGFLGPNGSGKSTTIRMLAGLLAPTSGSITGFGGLDVAQRHREMEAANRLHEPEVLALPRPDRCREPEIFRLGLRARSQGDRRTHRRPCGPSAASRRC